MTDRHRESLKIAVVGTGISGLSAAWLLSKAHDITVFEREGRVGGHANTVDVETGRTSVPVDTGFIVYNEAAYPNLTALFSHLKVPTQQSDMSFAVSLRDGDLEYSGTNFAGLFAQKRNLARPRFWSMLSGIRRFYSEAPQDAALLGDIHRTLGDYLDFRHYGSAFRDDHLLPMAAAIWSAPPETMLNYPAASFIRFHDNHGLLRTSNRPQWRTVAGGSRVYVEKLTKSFVDRVEAGVSAESVRRCRGSIEIRDSSGRVRRFDHVVIATHANDALAMLADPSPVECQLLSAFHYSDNVAILHTDASLMPRRKAAWSSWNYIGPPPAAESAGGCMVTYWMNRLQGISTPKPLFITLNPRQVPAPEHFIRLERYEHPIFDRGAMNAQRTLWSIQGQRNTWFCGAHFGSGFHEDGLQAGLAVAEALGGVRRPWQVEEESGRICVGNTQSAELAPERAA